MQGKQLFEYALIRIVPLVEREEFFNAGVIVYVKRPAFLDMDFFIAPEKWNAFSNEVSLDEVESYLQSMKAICRGNEQGGPIASLESASRFRWLTAWRSTIIQTSRVHPGFCEHPEQELRRLMEKMVL